MDCVIWVADFTKVCDIVFDIKRQFSKKCSPFSPHEVIGETYIETYKVALLIILLTDAIHNVVAQYEPRTYFEILIIRSTKLYQDHQ